MCGITGQLAIGARPTRNDLSHVTAGMASRLVHRGPDDVGIWCDDLTGICLAHRRLSILDLSPGGHQPMFSGDGRYVIAFNGEIYNHADLLREFPFEMWRGHSDTEVMLAVISRYGVEKATQRFVGMFAYALWDTHEKQLYLVRDRLGEKPLYYGWIGNTFVFASELKALSAHPAWKADIDRDALALYLQFNYIPAPYTIYRGFSKLSPGCMAVLDAGKRPGAMETRKYWTLPDVSSRSLSAIDPEHAVMQVEEVLGRAVAQQMVADVPVGAFLSGGIDSSLIVALMQRHGAGPVRTYTIGFHESGFNEAEYARAVASHLGTEHTEFYVTPRDALDVIALMPKLYDEPFADSSQLPTYLVAGLTRNHVTVSLSGDGGDELFGGYNRYSWGNTIWDRIKWLPLPVRQAFAGFLRTPSPQAWDRLFAVLGSLLPKAWRYSAPGDKLHKLAKLLGARRACDVYLDLISLWSGSSLVPGSSPLPTVVSDPGCWPEGLNFTEFMMYLDINSYLPDDILVKVDRATMGVSLESRAPFLDYRVAELAWRLPLNIKIRHGQGKWPLRQILYKYVPRELVERPKMGFGVPIDRWLRTSLRDWAESLLDESRLHDEGFLDPLPIRQKWDEHLSGKRNWQYHLWGVLMFQAWKEQWT